MFDTIALYTGYVTLVIITVIAVFLAFDISYEKDEYFIFKVLGFGIIRVPTVNDRLIENIKKTRKDDNAGIPLFNSRVYASCPTWFNKYVWNIGGAK